MKHRRNKRRREQRQVCGRVTSHVKIVQRRPYDWEQDGI